MTDIIRLFARLNQKTQHFTDAGGDHNALRTEDIIYCLKGLPDSKYLIGRAAFAGDDEAREKAVGYVLEKVKDMAQRGHWKVKKGLALEMLVRIAIYEATCPIECNDCRGRGFLYMKGGKVEPCQKCNESGRGKLSERWKARQCNVPDRTWHRNFIRYYEQVYRLVEDWKNDSYRHLLKNLTAGENPAPAPSI